MAFMEEEVFEKVRGLLAESLGISKEDVKSDSSLQKDLGVDSLDAVEIVMESEDVFGIKIPDEDAKELKTVRQIVDYILAHQ